MDKSSKSVAGDSERIVGETSNPSMDKCQEDREDPTINADTRADRKIGIPEIQGSPELRRKVSRTMAVRDDARRLKTATLDRMGKIFKLKSTQVPLHTDAQPELVDSKTAENTYVDEQSRKDKTNSLGRMFKLVNKNGEPRKLFQQSRAGSLSRILRRKSTGGNEDSASGSENSPGVFSRMLTQWRNRSVGGNTTAEPNLCASTVQENKTLSRKPLSSSKQRLSSSSADPSQLPSLPVTAAFSEESSANVEYPA